VQNRDTDDPDPGRKIKGAVGAGNEKYREHSEP
jgi:hypothetical protein